MTFGQRSRASLQRLIDQILADSAQVLSEIKAHDAAAQRQHDLRVAHGQRRDPAPKVDIPPVPDEAFKKVQASTLTLLARLPASRPDVENFHSAIEATACNQKSLAHLRGIIASIQDNLNAGMFDDLILSLQAEISSDYYMQAQEILQEMTGAKPPEVANTPYDFAPAAVFLGAILENAMRQLCRRHVPAIDTDKPDGKPKAMDALNNELKKAGAYNDVQHARINAARTTRNAAAHGEFHKLNASNVEELSRTVRDFIVTYLN